MNRYPSWANALIVLVVLWGALFTLPNFFGEAPAVQVSSAKSTVKMDSRLQTQVQDILTAAKLEPLAMIYDGNSVRARFADVDTQQKAKDVISRALNPDAKNADYVVALNLLSRSPSWLTSIRALPMYLGLDLRGGVHFLLQVDMQGALTKRLDSTASSLRTELRSKDVRHSGITRVPGGIQFKFRDEATREKARGVILDAAPDLQATTSEQGADFLLTATLKPVAERDVRDSALKQNISTLHNRINELGVAEPVIQQQGADRIVVQLPGVQDVARAKELIGRTATLEVRLVDEGAMASGDTSGADVFPERKRDGSLSAVPLKKQVILTGDHIVGAAAGFDSNHSPDVNIVLDDTGGRIMRDTTRDNIGHLMAMVLFEKDRGEAISVARIQGEFGNRFQITGQFSPQETNNLAILLRSGSLAAPMEIIEERVIGPSLGAENITKGFHSTLGGFAAIAVFMMFYYRAFGSISVVALAVNLLLLVALLSVLQATLTLPGIAAMALALGMAIDANVLINERVREELRNGVTPQASIHAGYERAFATILDSNVTTLIAGIALLAFGSGPVRGFAVVHCLGILTSMFSAVVVSRAIVNFLYGRRRKLESVSIGQVWKPGGSAAGTL
ncbi:MAG: protein translocase subunit SecD [Rhodocyclaceae bacterium]|nr:protein translocase subunit SecD [Rhodocyclaceae bacterium]MBX3667095.1 protein translocase subunit SecD [Rhodocyclaceae bacterium]